MPFVVQSFALVLFVGLLLGAPSPARAGLPTDGLGSVDVSTGGPVLASSTGNNLTFTYTADPSSGITAGTVEIDIPEGWTAPQTGDPSAAGYVSPVLGLSTAAGADGTGGTITLSALTLLPGAQIQVSYGAATAPPAGGSDTFSSSEGDGVDTPVQLSASPSVQVLAPDGSGAMVVAPGSVPSGYSQSLTFTYTADPGGIQGGTLDLAVPAGWTTPQTADSTSAGFVATSLGTSDSLLDSAGTVSVLPGGSGTAGTIELTGLTLAAGDTLLVSYAGLAPAAGPYTFTTDESSAGGTVQAISSQPQITVTPVSAPGAPSLVSVTPENGQVQLSWSAPADDGGGPVTGYLVNVYPGGDTSGTPTTVDAGPTDTSATVGSLTDGQEYTFTVQAVNSAGPGSASGSLSATLPTAPGAPSLTSADPADGQVQLSWSAPADGGSSIQDYVIDEYVGTAASGSPAAVIPTPDPSTGYTVTGLTNGTTYTFTVAAVNSIGTSAASSSLSAMPLTTPASPTLDPPTAGNAQVQLSWAAPDDGGSAIHDYVINEYVGTDTSGGPVAVITTPDASTAYTVTGLTNGTTYTFTVAAKNSAGPGAASAPQSVTPATTPGAPTLSSASPGNGQVQLTWSAPSNDGGASVIDYVIDEYQGGDTSSTPVPVDIHSAATSATVSGLTNGHQYTFTVQAINQAGGGSSSGSVSATPRTVPSAPTLSATPSAGTVALSWTAPDDGGAAIDHYLIQEYAGPSAAGTPTTLTTTSTNQTVTGLTDGSPYTFEIEAVNAAGGSEPSNAVTATPATVPSAPKLLATVAGSGLVEIVWDPPTADGGAAISAYEVLRSTVAGAPGTKIATVAPGASPNTYIDQAVTNGTTYYYEVTALNWAGQSGPSIQFSAEPQSFLPPPVLVKTIKVGGNVVTFSAPNACIRAGKVSGSLTVSSASSKRTALSIRRAVFKVGTLAVKTVTRRKRSSVSIHVTLHARHMLAKHSYRFLSVPSIAVGKGVPHRHTLRLQITSC